MKEESIVFIGGDMRMVYAAKKLSMRHRCTLSGFGSLETGLPSVAAGARYSAAVLPIFAGGAREIRCPFANKAYDINILTLHLDCGSVVFAGKVFPELEKLCAENGYTLYDYLAREELAVLNADDEYTPLVIEDGRIKERGLNMPEYTTAPRAISPIST